MLVKLSKERLDALGDHELAFACFEPIIPLIRAKSDEVKTEVYKQLSEGQKALFMFNAYYNHAKNSLAEFYWWTAYYMAQPKAWPELLGSLKYFRLETMLELLKGTECDIKKRMIKEQLENGAIAYTDLEKDTEFLRLVTERNNQFELIAPEALKIIGVAIRKNPNKFIDFEE